jgi:hypothetical protein
MKESDFAKIALPKWQRENPNARVFRNNTGMAWQGSTVRQMFHGLFQAVLYKLRPIFFGVGMPTKDKKTGRIIQKGGGDYIGWTETKICDFIQPQNKISCCTVSGCAKCPYGKQIAIFTNLETKSKTGKESREQIKFRKLVQESGGVSIILKEGEE